MSEIKLLILLIVGVLGVVTHSLPDGILAEMSETLLSCVLRSGPRAADPSAVPFGRCSIDSSSGSDVNPAPKSIGAAQ